MGYKQECEMIKQSLTDGYDYSETEYRHKVYPYENDYYLFPSTDREEH